VLVDFSGTLICRLKIGHKPSLTLENNNIPPPHFCHPETGRTCYIRPGAIELLQYLMTHEHISLGALTSIQPKNAKPIWNFLTSEATKSLMAKRHADDLAAIENQNDIYNMFNPFPLYSGCDFNEKDVTRGINPWDTRRNLEAVWTSHQTSATIGEDTIVTKFDGRSTLVIDDSRRKMRYYPFNVLIVPEFGEADLKQLSVSEFDTTMKDLQDYIDRMLCTGPPRDVRTYVESNTFIMKPRS